MKDRNWNEKEDADEDHDQGEDRNEDPLDAYITNIEDEDEYSIDDIFKG